MGVPVIEGDLTQIYGASLRAHGPQDVGQVFEAKLGGVFEALELDLDLEISLLAFDLGFAGGALEQVSSLKVDFGLSALQAVVDGFRGARDRGCRRGNRGLGLRGR